MGTFLSPSSTVNIHPRLSKIAQWLALIAVAMSISAADDGGGGRYFPETGHSLDPTFESYFDNLGGERIMGYPITESFIDPFSGYLVQFLENARFELAPNAEGELQARLTDLGVLLGGWDLPLEKGRLPIGNNPGCRFYDATGHQVCHAFLSFYEANGGPAAFGLPVTEFRFENGRMVQYFRDFRLDWYPEATEGERIRVAPLGREHFQHMGYDSSFLEPNVPGDLADYPVLDIQVSSSVLKPLIGTGDHQQVYLVVSDQNRRPVPGAAALLAIHYPDGIHFRMMPITDANGVSQIDISLEGSIPGSRIALEYTVVYEDLSALTRDSFYIWY